MVCSYYVLFLCFQSNVHKEGIINNVFYASFIKLNLKVLRILLGLNIKLLSLVKLN